MYRSARGGSSVLTRRIASCVVEAKRKIASTFGYAEDTQRIQRGFREDTWGKEGEETIY